MELPKLLADGNLAAWAQVLLTPVSILAGLLGVWWQVRKDWRLHSATLVTALVDRFESAEWRRDRAHCAGCIERHRTKSESIDLSRNFPVLPHFEHIGYLLRTGAVDRMMVWNKFGWYMSGYYLALTEGEDLLKLARRQSLDPTIWKEFEWACGYFNKVYLKKGVDLRRADVRDKLISELIQWESSLVGPPQAPQ